MSETTKTVSVGIAVYGFDIPAYEEVNGDMTLGNFVVYLSNLVPDSQVVIRLNECLVDDTEKTTLSELVQNGETEITFTLVPVVLQIQIRNMTGQALKYTTYNGRLAYDATIGDLIKDIAKQLSLDDANNYLISHHQQPLSEDIPIWNVELNEYSTVIERK